MEARIEEHGGVADDGCADEEDDVVSHAPGINALNADKQMV